MSNMPKSEGRFGEINVLLPLQKPKETVVSQLFYTVRTVSREL